MDPGPGVLSSNKRAVAVWARIADVRRVVGMGAVLGFDWVQITCILQDWLGVDTDADLLWSLKVMESEMMLVDSEEREEGKTDA